MLSSWGAKGAVVWGDNRAPMAQTEDVIGELMHPLGEGLGCKRRKVREATSCLFNMCRTNMGNDLWVYYNNFQITKVTISYFGCSHQGQAITIYKTIKF